MTRSTVFIGGLIGFFIGFHQEHLYALAKSQRAGKSFPEARLYWAAIGGVVFPLAMLGYGWTGQPWIPWIVPCLFLVIENAGVFCMYAGVL